MWVDFLKRGSHINLDIYFVKNIIFKLSLLKKNICGKTLSNANICPIEVYRNVPMADPSCINIYIHTHI